MMAPSTRGALTRLWLQKESTPTDIMPLMCPASTETNMRELPEPPAVRRHRRSFTKVRTHAAARLAAAMRLRRRRAPVRVESATGHSVN